MTYRIGHAYDIHRLESNRKLILGGIEIAYAKGLLGHSDADCLLHAIAEAIIGALGLGDLGTRFSDSDQQYKDKPSSYFISEVKKMLFVNNYTLVNIDATIFIEEPMLRPYILNMKEKIASLLDIEDSQVNIKATRGEKLGYIGRSEGVAAEAVVLIARKKELKKL
jgi:2-C-methyl-D-erythritol 2,4-cyclodiphosphate synthase